MTAEEARTRGTASPAARAELRELLTVKAVSREWRAKFFAAVCAAEGLSSEHAQKVLAQLRRMPERATVKQAARMRDLSRTRLAPGPWIRPLLAKLDEGVLPAATADNVLRDLERLPVKAVVGPDTAPAGPVPFDDGYYAVRDGEGRARHYRVKTRDGLREVIQYTGPIGSRKHRQLYGAERRRVVDAIAADPVAAGALYAETAKRCTDCNQPIREDTARPNPGYRYGYGPKCWGDREARRRNGDAKAAVEAA